MKPASKRATAGTVTLSTGALAGAPSINPIPMEMTMETHITAPDEGATGTHVLILSESRGLQAPGGAQRFNTTFDGQPVMTRSAVPIYDTCRVLAAWGFTGKARFMRPDGTESMTVDIAEGAKLTVAEGPTGPRTRKFVPGKLVEGTKGSRNADVLTIGKVEA
jgi:hypothetical protein